MFEVASGNDSSSSDSIVNISRSGASSISTSPSTTTATTTSTTNEDKLKTRINQLLEDKKILEGRIRGYKTLSDMLVDCRKENDQLKAQLKELNTNAPTMLGTDQNASVGSPFSLVSLQAAQQNQNGQATSKPEKSLLIPQDQKPPSLSSPSKSPKPMDPKGPPIAHPPVSRPPSSLQESVSPSADLKETSTVSLPPVSGTASPAYPPQESIPKQESMEPVTGQLPDQPNTILINTTTHLPSMASENSSPELLQLDSDKYDEPSYEKVGLQLAMGHAGLRSSMYASGAGRPGESRSTDFPSLSSSISNGLAQPPSHHSSSNPPFMAMMHQSLTELSLNKQGCDLASEVEILTERLHSEPGNSMPAIALQMHQIAEQISKREQKERDQKNLIDTLMHNNQEMKRQMKIVETKHQAEVVALREQNTRLIQQLKSQPLDEQTKLVKSSGAHGDWVHVERPSHLGEGHVGTDQSLVDRVRTLEQEKAELLRANSNWKSQWDQMEHKHQLKLSELHSKVMLGEQDTSAMKARLAEQTTEFEGRMLEMKRRTAEEENQKEEAQHQQRLAERRVSELEEHVTELRTQLSDTARENQALSTELSILRARTSGSEMQMSGAAGASSAASAAAQAAEIGMLKEQLKVFAEDFEQERLDRTTAQAARDSSKKTAENIARQLQAVNSQVKHLQKQIKDRDDTISWTLRQNEAHQRQAAEYKKKLASEWEEKQNLQRRLLVLEQQLCQQPQRNPYLSETQTNYNPPPVHQPPPPPRSAPYFGNQGAGAASPARNRSLGPSVPIEHLPGAWTCVACTYINYPGRTVCESCGLVNTPRSQPDQFGFASHDMYGPDHALLMSRGGEQNQGGMTTNNGDLVIDSGAWHSPQPTN